MKASKQLTQFAAAVIAVTGFQALPAVSAPLAEMDAHQYRVLRKFKIAGEGSWDYLTIDSAAKRLYIARSNRVQIIDIEHDKLIDEITDLEGVHGVTLVSSLQKGFITCGKSDKVCIFDLKTSKIIKQLPTGKKPDASLYDSKSGKIFVFNNGGTTATVIDAAAAKVTAQIELGGSPESGVTDDAGKIYVNLEDKNQIVVIDTSSLKVLAHWSLGKGEEPTGIAMDRKSNRLFSGCHNQMLIILDALSGKIVASKPIGIGVDAVGFDPSSQNIFASNNDGTMTVIHENDASNFVVQQNLLTQKGARTLAVDHAKNQIWSVSAETMEPKAEAEARPAGAPTQGEHRHHRSYVPDSFNAIVVGR